MKNRTSGYSSDNENSSKKQQDLSILRKPILTSITGFLEAKRAFENGTEEIRRLLSRECDILYECKTCRNVFRSLTNFISHKRVYCRDFYNNTFDINRNGFIDQDISTIIQAEEEYTNSYKSNNNHKTSKKNIISSTNINSNNNNNNNNNQQTSNNNNNNNNIEKSNKDLTSIIERLINREQKNRTLRLSDFYEQVDLKLTQEEILKKNHILQLDGIPNSNVAVYQTVKKEDCDNIKKEILEINDIVNCKTILGPDGKLLDTDNYNCNDENHCNITNSTTNETKIAKGIENNLNEKNIICEICKLKFSTEKTLKLHIQTKHILSTYVYQCPSCSQTFLKPSEVIRHLSNDHKKSLRRIRQMRETIFKRRMRIDEVQVKGPSRELARLQGNQIDNIDAENPRAWIDNIDRSPRNSPLCNYCGKKFERRAVLTTHLQTCTAKHRQTPTLISKKLNELTFSRENSSTSRSSTSSPANNNSITNGNPVSSNTSATSSLLAFAAKSIANATFEPIKSDETKIGFNSSNKIIEASKPRIEESVAESINKRKRRKPETIIIRKSELVLKSIKEDQNIESVISDLKNTKLDQKNVIKKSKQIPDLNTIKEIQVNGNLETKDILIPETIEKSIIQMKQQEKNAPSSSVVFKKRDFNREKFLKLVTPRKDLIFYCRICKKAFSALSNLRRHISMFHYRRRKFGCHICPYRAFRKYDVVNHLNSAHSLTGEQNLDQILVAEDNYGKDDVDGDIIISDNGEFKGEKEEDIENIKADIAKANMVKNKMHHLNKDENYIAKNSSGKKGRKPKEPYVIKNMRAPVENSIPLENIQSPVDVINPAPGDTIEIDLKIVPIEETNVGKLYPNVIINSNESANTTENDKISNVENSEKCLEKNNEEEDGVDKIPGSIKRSDSILSISSNEDRTGLTINTSSASPTLKRPIRNRVKPVKKDFVYDLSNFLKKDMLCIERESFSFGKATGKRRNIIVNLDDSSRESSSSNSTISSSSSNNVNNVINKTSSTDDERRKLVSKSVANTSSQSSTLENKNTYLNNTADPCILNTKYSPSMNQLKKEQSTQSSLEIDPKSKILNISNGIDKTSPNFTNLFKSFEDLKKVKHVRRTSDDSVIRLFNKKRKLTDFADLASMSDSSLSTAGGLSNKIEVNVNGTVTENLKPEKSLENALVNNFVGGQINNNKEMIKNVPNEIKPILNLNQNRISEIQQNCEEKYVIKCPSDKEFQEYLMKNDLSEPVKKINLAAVLEQQENDSVKTDSTLHQQNSLLVSGKRITLLQRLADNKNKKMQESLLRNALEN
ncbi:uncharacterized protein MAL13P1.304 [Condylostylus longicornis]|uniref:uncharacterized protein MAL13P1.304 n=1 Tax=Condylostylus longicornis TaxID=2530218 RepID=UPI00244E21A1|nr:uncharacterized protein MAL13P1.304 [Condylostylus longicornis]XP_055375682.1 uncharacterized protein MAL13P1.304 [Condylostylus longicornis]XP_055375690.1 uncharacterized protein MAL13P1.304 [Condylostylus longicornis]